LPADLLVRLRAVLPAGYDASSIELSFRGSAPGAGEPHHN
jgi:hypothetical protein